MALSFGENLSVLGNIKLTDVRLVAGAFRTIASGSDTGSITVQRVEDGQIVYIQSEDKLIKATKSGASVSWNNFYFPSASSGGGGTGTGIFAVTGSEWSTTRNLQVTGSLKVTGNVFSNSERVATPSYFANNQTAALEEDGNGDMQFISGSITGSKFLVDGQFEFDENGDFQPKEFFNFE